MATYTAYTLSLNGLWNEVINYVDKYLPISKDQTSEYLTSGSTAVCYRFGDYVFKIIRSPSSNVSAFVKPNCSKIPAIVSSSRKFA